jgi:hypothetical protein
MPRSRSESASAGQPSRSCRYPLAGLRRSHLFNSTEGRAAYLAVIIYRRRPSLRQSGPRVRLVPRSAAADPMPMCFTNRLCRTKIAMSTATRWRPPRRAVGSFPSFLPASSVSTDDQSCRTQAGKGGQSLGKLIARRRSRTKEFRESRRQASRRPSSARSQEGRSNWRFARSDFCQNTSRARAPRKMAVALPGVPGQITWASGPKRMWSAMAIS